MQNWMRKQVPAMRVAYQIANASKHVNIDRNDAGIVAEIEYERPSGSRFRLPKDICVSVDGRKIWIEHVLQDGLEFWRHFLDRTLPESPFD